MLVAFLADIISGMTNRTCLISCGSSSPDSPEGREARGKGDAGGDIWPSAAHLASERPGRSHQVHQQKRKASGPLRLHPGQKGPVVSSSCGLLLKRMPLFSPLGQKQCCVTRCFYFLRAGD